MVDKDIVYKENLEIWGINAILLKMIEETSELNQQISKFLINYNKYKNNTPYDLIEEMVDTEIVLEQLKNYFLKGTFKKIFLDKKNYKIERLNKRIKEIKRGEQIDG